VRCGKKDGSLQEAVLHSIEEKVHGFSRGMNPITHDTINLR